VTASLRGKTLFIGGGSRGIALAIALRAGRDGANVAIAAKTGSEHPTLPGTIYSAAEAIEAAGGRAPPVLCDIRDEAMVEEAVAKTVERFGGLDICVNNASAVKLTPILETSIKRLHERLRPSRVADHNLMPDLFVSSFKEPRSLPALRNACQRTPKAE
jgi:citronellol/citronellal dehydrogenase